ncbi:sensor domain-containing diguanylate cyclase [Vibrio sp. Hep-1b-8]|nr:sensor domain-containing diguanylate cyclase [Vibrio sp. Hep-1b-8]
MEVLRFFISVLVLVSFTSWGQAESPQKLVVANSKAWKPFSFINQEGQPDGILIEYWQEFGHKNNIDVEFLLLDWQSSLEAVKDGRADVHAGLLWSEGRDSYLDFTAGIMSIDTQLFISQEHIGSSLDEFMLSKHDNKVGVVAGGYEEEFTKLHFPNLNLVSFANNKQMIESAFAGDLDAFVADLQVANFYIHTSQKAPKFIGVRHLYSGELRAAVAEGNTALQQRISQGINSFGVEDKQKIFNRWMYISTVYPDYLVPLAALAIGIFTFGYIVALNITVKVKTKALEQANRELKTLSETDQLTGLSNRRHFVSELKQRLACEGPVTLMIFDIDDFKKVNDRYGHSTGDEVIRKVALAANAIVPEQGLIGRIGGEEFAVVICELEFGKVVDIAENICASVRELSVLDEGELQTSVSLGCAHYSTNNGEITLSDADHLMYQSKIEGKDRVTAICYP